MKKSLVPALVAFSFLEVCTAPSVNMNGLCMMISAAGRWMPNKWSMEMENSSAYPQVSDGQVNCSATLNDGTCKIGLKEAVVG